MASRIFCSTSLRVAPVDTQPGRSGEYAENPVDVASTTIRYFFISVPPASRHYSAFPAQVHHRFSRNGDETGFDRVFVLTMAAAGSDEKPSIGFDGADDIADLHSNTRSLARQVRAGDFFRGRFKIGRAHV